MATQSVDLAQLFGTVASALAQNQSTLNTADTYNHDHGDNMVQIFEVITQAMKEKNAATPADQLAYASQLLRSKSQSGSAKIYAEGLSEASSRFQGKKTVTPNSAMTLIQALLGAQKKVSSDLDALLNAVMSNSRMSSSDYRSQSGAMVANALLKALTGMSK